MDSRLNDNSSSTSMPKSLIVRLGINDVLVAELKTIRSQMKQIIKVMKKHTLLVCVHAAVAFTSFVINVINSSVRLSMFGFMSCITIQSFCIYAMFSFATRCTTCRVSFIQNDDISQVKTVVVQSTEP